MNVLLVPLIIVGVLVVLAMVLAGMYNRLVTLRNRYKNGFAQIDVQLQRRYDLIPNLVETAKAYIQHERGTLEAVTAARNQAATAAKQAAANPGNPAAMQGLSGAEGALAGVMTRFFAVMEAYPTLKANETKGRHMEELSSTENKVAFARQAFNDGVMEYNTQRETFPTVMVAGMFGFTPAELFEVKSDAERQAPKVSFS